MTKIIQAHTSVIEIHKAIYPGILVKDDLSWDGHILHLCKSMNYYADMLRSLIKIFHKQLLLKVYESCLQSKLDYGLSIWGCTTQGNLDLVQRIQTFWARMIYINNDYINPIGIHNVESLGIQGYSPFPIRQHRDYFLSVVMFKCVYGFAPHYLCNDDTMFANVHDYDTRSSENRNLYAPTSNK